MNSARLSTHTVHELKKQMYMNQRTSYMWVAEPGVSVSNRKCEIDNLQSSSDLRLKIANDSSYHLNILTNVKHYFQRLT